MTDDECAFHYGSDSDLIYSKIVQDEHRVLWRQGDWTSNFDQFVSDFFLLLYMLSLQKIYVHYKNITPTHTFNFVLKIYVAQ